MKRLRLMMWASAVLAVCVFLFLPGPPTTIPSGKGLVIKREALVNNGTPLTPVEHRRPPDQTFLTFPEWFLVFGPAEQADYFQAHTSTGFPFLQHVRQMWEGYRVVYSQIRGNFPFNRGYHVMIVVIATSSTAEFGIKAAYETVIGRLTDPSGGAVLTDEDRFNAAFAEDYVKFIETTPWYQFDFKSRLARLWTETSLFGPYPLRKLERKYILTTELAVKTVYGWLMGLGTRSAYERPKLTTVVVAENYSEKLGARLPEAKVLEQLPPPAVLLALPRYAPFTPYACELATSGVEFREVAGNTSAIMLTALAPRGWRGESLDYQVIFTQTVPTKPEIERVALATPVSSLSKTLRTLLGQKVKIEHVYDF